MKLELPGRNLAILIVIFALVNPLNYLIMVSTAPEGKVFMGYVDDAFQTALMKSVHYGFRSPWEPDRLVFENPELGASEAFVIIGTVPALLNLNLLLALAVFKFMLSVAYTVVVYNLMKRLLPEDKLKAAFLIFLFSSGIGWLIYGGTYVAFGHESASVVGFAFTNEFEELGGGAHALSHMTRVYWLLPEITGLLSVLFLLERRRLLSGLFLGLTILFYPTFAAGFSAIILAYLILENYSGKISFGLVKSVARGLAPVIAGSFLFAVYWLLKIIAVPDITYTSWFSGLAPVTLAVTFGITLPLAVYGFVKTGAAERKNLLVFAALIVVSLLASLMQFYAISGGNAALEAWLKNAGLLGIGKTLFGFSLLIDALMLSMIGYLFYKTLKKPLDVRYKFVILWILVIIAITVLTPARAGGLPFVFWWGARLRWFLLVPLSMAVVFGIDYLNNKRFFGVRLTRRLVLLAVILVSLPSLLGFNFYMHQVARSSGLVYLEESDYRALKFLAGAEDGRVLSSPEIGINIPFFTGKTTLLYKREYGQLQQRDIDYVNFYSAATPDGERKEILEKNGIKYVFYGRNEKTESGNGQLNLENSDFLEKIYDDGTQIYRFRGA